MLQALHSTKLGQLIVSADAKGLQAVAAASVVLGLAVLFIKGYLTRSSGSKLRTFNVTGNNVVEVLEEAHREVGFSLYQHTASSCILYSHP